MNKKIHFLFGLGWIIYFCVSFYSIIKSNGLFGDITDVPLILTSIFFIIVHFLLGSFMPRTKAIYFFSILSPLLLFGTLLYNFASNSDTYGNIAWIYEFASTFFLCITLVCLLFGLISIRERLNYTSEGNTLSDEKILSRKKINLFNFKFLHGACMIGWVALSFLFLIELQIGLLGSMFGIIVHYLLWKDAPKTNSIFIFSFYSFIYLIVNIYGFLFVDWGMSMGGPMILLIFGSPPYILLGIISLVQVLKYKKKLKIQSGVQTNETNQTN